MLVEERAVVAAIRAGAKTVDAVGEACDAGSGCGSCRAGIELLIQQEARRRRPRMPERFLRQLGLFSDDNS